jgi:hypothetical protein
LPPDGDTHRTSPVFLFFAQGHARAAPAFECAWCCRVYTFVASISSDAGIPIFPSVMSLISLVSTVLLIWKIAQMNKSSIEKGFMFASRPILAIREERTAPAATSTWLLPWYFVYVIANALFMLTGLIFGILTPPTMVEGYINIVLCGLCDLFDLLLFFFLLLPRINRATKALAFLLACGAGLLVSLIAAFVPETVAHCPWCSQHYPINAVGVCIWPRPC